MFRILRQSLKLDDDMPFVDCDAAMSACGPKTDVQGDGVHLMPEGDVLVDSMPTPSPAYIDKGPLARVTDEVQAFLRLSRFGGGLVIDGRIVAAVRKRGSRGSSTTPISPGHQFCLGQAKDLDERCRSHRLRKRAEEVRSYRLGLEMFAIGRRRRADWWVEPDPVEGRRHESRRCRPISDRRRIPGSNGPSSMPSAQDLRRAGRAPGGRSHVDHRFPLAAAFYHLAVSIMLPLSPWTASASTGPAVIAVGRGSAIERRLAISLPLDRSVLAAPSRAFLGFEVNEGRVQGHGHGRFRAACKHYDDVRKLITLRATTAVSRSGQSASSSLTPGDISSRGTITDEFPRRFGEDHAGSRPGSPSPAAICRTTCLGAGAGAILEQQRALRRPGAACVRCTES